MCWGVFDLRKMADIQERAAATSSAMIPEEQNRLLTRGEVQDRFGISKRFLEVAAMKKEGPRICRIGRSVFYRLDDIHRWIEACVDSSTSTDLSSPVRRDFHPKASRSAQAR